MFRFRSILAALILCASSANTLLHAQRGEVPIKLANLQRMDGFLPLYWDNSRAVC